MLAGVYSDKVRDVLCLSVWTWSVVQFTVTIVLSLSVTLAFLISTNE